MVGDALGDIVVDAELGVDRDPLAVLEFLRRERDASRGPAALDAEQVVVVRREAALAPAGLVDGLGDRDRCGHAEALLGGERTRCDLADERLLDSAPGVAAAGTACCRYGADGRRGRGRRRPVPDGCGAAPASPAATAAPGMSALACAGGTARGARPARWRGSTRCRPARRARARRGTAVGPVPRARRCYDAGDRGQRGCGGRAASRAGAPAFAVAVRLAPRRAAPPGGRPSRRGGRCRQTPRCPGARAGRERSGR